MQTVSNNGQRAANNCAQLPHSADAQIVATAPQSLHVLLDNVPSELKIRDRWVCWKYQTRGGKLTKVPYQPNGSKAAVDNPTTWSNFDAIATAYKTDKFSGIGFVLSDDDDLSGIDLDGMIDAETGELSDDANAILSLFNSYSEISPSGRGVRILTRGKLPEGARRKANIEAYDGGRYLTITGHRIDGTPSEIGERPEELAQFHARFLAREPKRKPAPSAPNTMFNGDDAELISRARNAKNGAKFSALWNGDLSGHGDDHSAADAALCAYLYYWTQGNASRMDALFRQSGLMRDKWNDQRGTQTYGEKTIAHAIENGGNVYEPRIRAAATPATSDTSEVAAPVPSEQTPDPDQKNHLTPEQIRAAFKATCSESAPVTLAELVALYRKWMFVKDDGLIKVALATFAANLCDGDPVWLMIVGGSSSGKTETINPLSALPYGRLVGTLTESSFLSGSPKRDKAKDASGGLLREMGAFGVMLFKDFTSILSLHHDKRISVLAALREVYDGAWTRDIGTDGGRKLEWRGKMGIIACCTDAIESAHAVSGAMGERFMRYRLQHNDDDQRAMTRQALRRVGRDAQMRTELEEAVTGFFGALEIESAPEPLTEADEDRLIGIAMLTAKARSVVDRDAKTRDIELTHDAEIPVRLASMLRRVLHGLRVIGVPNAEAWTIIQKVALDSIPKLRAEIIRLVADEIGGGGYEPLTAKRIEKALKTSAQSTRRALEELRAHCILDSEDATIGNSKVADWKFSELGVALWNEGFSPFPVKSVTTHSPTNSNANGSNTDRDLYINLPLRIATDKTGNGGIVPKVAPQCANMSGDERDIFDDVEAEEIE